MEFDLEREASYPTPFRNSTLFPVLLMALAVQKHTPTTKKLFKPVYDYIVVGSGSAGSVVAARLSDTSRTVLLLEAGESAPLLTELPGAQPYFIGTDVYWNYMIEPQKYAARRHVDRRVPTGSGKVVGGSSTDNSIFYIRGNHADFDYWERLGAKGWNWTSVFPYFLKPEDNTDPDIANNGYHSVGGPLTVGRYKYDSVLKKNLKRAAIDMGYDYLDINGRRQTGFADTQGSLRKGQRCSVAKAYLVPRERKSNLDIITEAYVTKVIIEKKTAVGVLFDYKGSSHFVRARCEVIVSAGSVRTPHLLMHSGIGPRKTLEKFGIPVIADLPVGKNFHDPAGTLVNFVSTRDRPTIEDKLKDDKYISEYIHRRSGPLAGVMGNFGLAFLTDDPIEKYHDLPYYQLFFLEGVYGKSAPFGLSQEVYDKVFGPYIGKPVIQCVSQDPVPQSRGYVTIRSRDPYDDPAINPNYLKDPRDLRRIVTGMKACYRIMENPFMKRLGYTPFTTRMPGCEGKITSDKYLECYARSLAIPTFHQAGTARMGDISDPRTVVDTDLRVKGIRNLRVIDSSVIPQNPRGGTNNPVIMIAEKISEKMQREQ